MYITVYFLDISMSYKFKSMFNVNDKVTSYMTLVNALKEENIDNEFIKEVKDSKLFNVKFLNKIENFFINRKDIDPKSLKENEINFLNKIDTEIELFMHKNKNVVDKNLNLESLIKDNINSFLKENTAPVTDGFKGFINSICKLFNIDAPYKKEDVNHKFKEKLQNICHGKTNESNDKDEDEDKSMIHS